MIIKLISTFLILAIVGISGAAPLVAQSGRTEREMQAAKVKAKIQKRGLGEKATVKVKLYNETSYKGYLSEANENDFVVVDKAGGSHTVNYADVRSIGGNGLSTGAKIGIGIGIGAGAVLAVLAAVIASND